MKHFIVKKPEHLVWKEIISFSIVYCYHFHKKINGKFKCQFNLYWVSLPSHSQT